MAISDINPLSFIVNGDICAKIILTWSPAFRSNLTDEMAFPIVN